MASYKCIFFICSLYAILCVPWIYKAVLPFLSSDSFVWKNFDLDIRSKNSAISDQTVVQPTSDKDLFNVIFIGYGKFSHHKFPEHCDCNGDPYYVTNDTCGIKDADAVIFTNGARRGMTLESWRRYHRERSPSQLWVLGTHESPLTCVAVRPPDDMKMVYNLSFTYHSRSDFPNPYGFYTKYATQQNGSVNWYSKKSKLIRWTSSHCPLSPRHYKRRDFAYALKEHINITMYGTCGDGRFDGEEYTEAVTEHKFSLILENSCCSEYITEKFWDSLLIYNQVPVVYGATREEYDRIAPPKSYIFMQDFSSLEELAGFITKVGSSEIEYNEYHYWRRLGYVTKQRHPEDRIHHCNSICRMSDTVKQARAGKKFQYDEMSDVFFGGCRDCQKELDFFY
ncbi:4-galactosyl-N-acetylglucosaminide 3-alpha-L-fucosyltransferase FUT6-like [Apostichopus japonicus]|uniref:4-galactosyl-N-acetylglucosaminide 3-alpha-L-fucosyltransferase FUT6-like n=1 Tax=Stichopus japonicus TaxID=307972 RepID=UPI003AB7797C